MSAENASAQGDRNDPPGESAYQQAMVAAAAKASRPADSVNAAAKATRATHDDDLFADDDLDDTLLPS